MTPQFDNTLMSSLLLYLDNRIMKRGEAFQNIAFNFFPGTSYYQGFNTYYAPYRQLIADQSVTGASVPTGIYLDGNPIGLGDNGFSGVNWEKGLVYFSAPISNASSRLSGNFAIKDFNIKMTYESEERILFETKYRPRPKVEQTLSGLVYDEMTYPVIYLKESSSTNEPFAFGGQDETIVNVSAIILADNSFNLNAVTSILRDLSRTNVPIINSDEMPYDSLERWKNGVAFNYTGITANKTPGSETLFIEDTNVLNFNSNILSQIKSINPEVYPGLVSLTISKVREPRRCF